MVPLTGAVTQRLEAAVSALRGFIDAWRGADVDLVARVDARSRLDRLRLSDSPR